MSVNYNTESVPRRFRLDEEGICDPLWDIGVLAWKDVRQVFAKRDGTREFVCFVVKDRAALKARQGLLRRLFSHATRSTDFGDLTVDVARAGVRADEVVQFASQRIFACK